MSKIVYKGIRHTDVIANTIDRGGEIVEVYSSRDPHTDTHKIVAEYLDGLTVLTDELVYTKDGLLQTWRVFHRGGETYLLFDRAEYDYYLSYHRTKEKLKHA